VLDYELVALAKSLRVKPEELLPREPVGWRFGLSF
jgi:hypothetical protein